jgi:hypothetical protein
MMFSLMLHVALTSFFLTIPIYAGGGSHYMGYPVYLIEEGGEGESVVRKTPSGSVQENWNAEGVGTSAENMSVHAERPERKAVEVPYEEQTAANKDEDAPDHVPREKSPLKKAPATSGDESPSKAATPAQVPEIIEGNEEVDLEESNAVGPSSETSHSSSARSKERDAAEGLEHDTVASALPMEEGMSSPVEEGRGNEPAQGVQARKLEEGAGIPLAPANVPVAGPYADDRFNTVEYAPEVWEGFALNVPQYAGIEGEEVREEYEKQLAEKWEDFALNISSVGKADSAEVPGVEPSDEGRTFGREVRLKENDFLVLSEWSDLALNLPRGEEAKVAGGFEEMEEDDAGKEQSIIKEQETGPVLSEVEHVEADRVYGPEPLVSIEEDSVKQQLRIAEKTEETIEPRKESEEPITEESAPLVIDIEVPEGDEYLDVEKDKQGLEPVAEIEKGGHSEKEGIVEEIISARNSPDESDMVGEVLTPWKNRTPSRKEYAERLDGEKALINEEMALEAGVDSEGKEEWGIPLPIRKDIEIEVSYDGDESGVFFRFLKKAHPMLGGRGARGKKPEDITDDMGRKAITEEAGHKVFFHIAEAEKMAYAFSIRNTENKDRQVDVRFHLYDGSADEREKEYKGLGLGNNEVVRFLFVMPERIFWDDDEYFTGVIEGPNDITKFNDVSGMVWKEKKGN